jgi:NTP pyrophosphatase (non-canonical NTP hydrolase)
VFQVTNDEPGSEELLQAQLQRSGLISEPPSPQSPQIMELMTFIDYQITSSATAVYPETNSIIYCTLGLCGETGEVAEKIKKVLRDNNGELDADSVTAIKLELGDVLWYIAQLATKLGLSLDAIAKANIQKTQDRQKRGQLGGSGDDR